MDGAEYTCPKCKGPAELSQDYEDTDSFEARLKADAKERLKKLEDSKEKDNGNAS